MARHENDASRVLITTARLIDGTGRAPLEPGAVIISNGRIDSVGTHVDSAAAVRFDFPASTIVPGLIDCNVHLTESGRPDPSTEEQNLSVRSDSDARWPCAWR
jgi:imidazolonepropionase-like amidohydrolase